MHFVFKNTCITDLVFGAKRTCIFTVALLYSDKYQAFNYPDIAGYPVGGAGDPGYFMMETHYDNPNMRAGK